MEHGGRMGEAFGAPRTTTEADRAQRAALLRSPEGLASAGRTGVLGTSGPVVTRLPGDAEPARWEIPVPLVMRRKTGMFPLTLNDRLHWRPKAELVAQIREAVGWHVKGLRIPPQEHVTVWLCYAPGSKRVIDGPNLAATSKPAIDALQDAGIVGGDDARWVDEKPVQLVYDGGPRRAWLVVEATRHSAIGN